MAVQANSDTFRFLDLPKEIRLMVYERLPITRRHSKVRMDYILGYKGSFTLVLYVLPLSILRVSKSIHEEAFAIPKHKLYHILSQPPRLILGAPDLFSLIDDFAFWLQAIYDARDMPGLAHSSLVQWAQHNFLYVGRTYDHPILAQFAEDNPLVPTEAAGVQLLISSPGALPHLSAANFSDRVPLAHILERFVHNDLYVSSNPTLDLLLPGASVSGIASLGPNLYNYTSQDLRDKLSFAFTNAPTYAHRGSIVELADWEKDWQATPEMRE